MNKIFKVVWSKVRNSYVVVSEIAKNTISGAARRVRYGKMSLAALTAAAVLAGGALYPNDAWAAEEVAALHQYVAVANQNNMAEYFKLDGKTQRYYVLDDNDNAIYYNLKTFNNNSVSYFIRSGYNVTVDSTTGKVTWISGTDPEGVALATIQHKAVWLKDDKNKFVTTVVNDNLHDVEVTTYAAATNAGGVEARTNYEFQFDWDGDEVYDTQLHSNELTGLNGKTATSTTMVQLTKGSDNNYYLNYGRADQQVVDIGRVYFLNAPDDTNPKPYTFVNKDGEIYTRLIRGANGEQLLSGNDSTGNAYTYWGILADDYNTLLRDSGMTVHQFHTLLTYLQENDATLTKADVKQISLAPATAQDATGGTIGLVYNDEAATSVPGTITVSKGQNATTKDNTIVFSQTIDGKTSSFAIDTGSTVRVTQRAEGAPLPTTTINVNGTDYTLTDIYTTDAKIDSENIVITRNDGHSFNIALDDIKNGLQLTDENTTYTVTESQKTTNDNANVVKKWDVYQSDTINPIATITDTDTKYEVSSAVGNGNVVKSYTITNNLGATVGTIEDTDTNNYVTDATLTGTTLNLTRDGVDGSVTVDLKDLVANLPSSDTNTVTKVEQGNNVTVTPRQGATENETVYTVSIDDSVFTAKNNLKVQNVADDNHKGVWQITDTNNNAVYKNTVLDKAEYANLESDYGYNYTISDTADNSVTLSDIASATKLQEVAGNVSTNTTNISNINSKITQLQNADIDKFVVAPNSDTNTTGGTVTLATKGNASIGTLTFASGGGSGGNDTYVTITDGSNNKITLNTGTIVVANQTSDDNVEQLKSISINGIDYIIPAKNDDGEIIQDYHLENGTIVLLDDTTGYDVGASDKVTGYTVDKNGIVEMFIYDQHDKTKQHDVVRIGNIAKASDVGDITILEERNLGNNVENTVVNHITNLYNQVATEAAKATIVTNADNNITVTTTLDTQTGNTTYNVDLANVVNVGTGDNQVTINGTTGSVTANTVTANEVKVGNVTINSAGIDAGNTKITNVADGEISASSKDAVNGSQLHQLQQSLNTNINAAKTEVVAGSNISVSSTQGADEQTIYTVNGTDTIKSGDVNVAADGTITLQHAGLNDEANDVVTTIKGLKDYAIDEQTVSVQNDTVTLKVTDKYDSNNTYNVTINDVASATTVNNLSGAVGASTSTEVNNHYKETNYLTEKNTVVDATVELDKQIEANREVIVQNYNNIQNLYGNDQYLDSKLNQLGNRVDKVGAGAAALAALHPMDFDPDDKLSFAAGVGNYAGENATALGAFYRPNEKVMMSVGGTMGNGENMVNMGVSFALDRTNNISNSRTAMAREIVDLRSQVATQGQQIAQLVALVQQLAGIEKAVPAMGTPFPDVPENHWAYEYVDGLRKRGVIEGYPDGTFSGDRAMTRYEFATMLFKAMQNGVVLSEDIRQEFAPELGRIRVDRIKGADNDAQKIERVRVNAAPDRDDYGSKIVQINAGA